MDDAEKLKRKKLMRYWVFGTAIITFAAVTVYTGLWIGGYHIAANKPIYMSTITVDMPIYIATIVASTAVLLFYELVYLKRQ